jgi:hypothetical protein
VSPPCEEGGHGWDARLGEGLAEHVSDKGARLLDSWMGTWWPGRGFCAQACQMTLLQVILILLVNLVSCPYSVTCDFAVACR